MVQCARIIQIPPLDLAEQILLGLIDAGMIAGMLVYRFVGNQRVLFLGLLVLGVGIPERFKPKLFFVYRIVQHLHIGPEAGGAQHRLARQHVEGPTAEPGGHVVTVQFLLDALHGDVALIQRAKDMQAVQIVTLVFKYESRTQVDVVIGDHGRVHRLAQRFNLGECRFVAEHQPYERLLIPIGAGGSKQIPIHVEAPVPDVLAAAHELQEILDPLRNIHVGLLAVL